MKQRTIWSLRLLDALGGVLVVTSLSTFCWFTILGTDATAQEVDRLRTDIMMARREVTSLRAERDRQQSMLNVRKSELSATGELPAEARLEEYFRALALLAEQNRLRVMRHNPLGTRSYPGLLERRFTYQVTGATADLIRFLWAVEQTDFWADVGYLKIEKAGSAEVSRSGDRVATLTISVFSASSGAKPNE
jgi:hypothetical protein